MSLLSNANMKALSDRLGYAYTILLARLGSSSGNPALETVRGHLDGLQDDVIATADAIQISDLLDKVTLSLSRAPAQVVAQEVLGPAFDALQRHCEGRGPAVNATINGIKGYFDHYNATPFTMLATPDFATALAAVKGVALGAENILHPAIHPDYNSAVSAEGIGSRAVGGSFTAGTAPTHASYAEVLPVIEVVTTFADGTAPPTVALAGTDSDGAACTYGAVTLTGDNPAAALSGITTSEAITAGTRQVVTLSSATGIVAGSVLTIDTGLNAEVIVVENVSSNDITAVFHKSHDSGVAVAGKTSFAVGNPSTGAGKRLRTLTGITIAGGGGNHTAGKVRIIGRMDRLAI